MSPWTSYQIRKIAVCACAGNAGKVPSPPNSKETAIPACITARASRTCRDACRDCLLAVAAKTFPAFPAHAHPQSDVFGKRPNVCYIKWCVWNYYNNLCVCIAAIQGMAATTVTTLTDHFISGVIQLNAIYDYSKVKWRKWFTIDTQFSFHGFCCYVVNLKWCLTTD